MQGERYLGRNGAGPLDELDGIPAPTGCNRVVMTCEEVTTLCPLTGQPDF